MQNLYEVILRPQSLFGTPLAGDTLFGHLCWQFAMDAGLLERPFTECVHSYLQQPFLVVSSALPRIKHKDKNGYAMPRPDLGLFTTDAKPASLQKEMAEKKEMKKKKWLFVDQELVPSFTQTNLLGLAEVTRGVLALEDGNNTRTDHFVIETERTHNSINRLTDTTGKGFDPYIAESISFAPGTTYSIFILADSKICPAKALETALKRLGAFGYGRDASTGLGRFNVESIQVRDIPAAKNANACYTLAPCVPQQGISLHTWAQPLTRFGKHGSAVQLGNHNPFKAPVIMAAAGAVFRMEALPQNAWIGRGITGVSKAQPDTIVQGYAPFLPCVVEV